MKKLLTLKHSLELLALIIALGAFLAVLQSFIIGKHFVIPTMNLILAVIFGNLARFAFQDSAWARHILFWIFAIAACHTFFALFWAITPREILGEAFSVVYGFFFLLFTFLSWQYARANALFSRQQGGQ